MRLLESETQAIDEVHFALLARAAGLNLSPSELVVMRRGYVGLQAFLARLPERPDFFDEPATTFEPLDTAAP